MQSIRKDLLEVFQKAVNDLLGEGNSIKLAMIQRAGRPEFGDYQANFAMSLAKHRGENPKALADAVIKALVDARLANQRVFAKLESAGPGFINITLTADYVIQHLNAFKPELYSGRAENQDKRVVIDYGSANIAKEMHVGHLRSTVIGDAIARILTFAGYTVARQSHLGDWGTQFGMLIEFMIEKNLLADRLTAMSDLTALYQNAKIAFDADAGFSDRARERVVKLQSGDIETLAIWQQLVDISVAYFEKIYQRLGVLLTPEDDCGESFYNPMLTGIVDELIRAGIAEKSQGALVIYLEGFVDREKNPLPMIIQKSDGGYLYSTTDLAAAKYRMNDLHGDRLIYVTDSRQEQHFAMVFAAVKRTNWAKKPVEFEHVPFGSVLGKDKKPFKTRSGETIRLELLIDEAIDRAYKIVDEKNPATAEEEKKHIAQTIGVGALKYADLCNERTKDYVFDWDTVLSFDGNTAPYLQNAYVRVQSIFRRGDIDLAKYNVRAASARIEQSASSPKVMITEPIEHELAIHLLEFHEVVARVVEDLMIHKLCTYLHQLAALFHRFYEHCKILNAPDEATKDSRLIFCVVVSTTLKQGLDLLGVRVLEKM
jgi:arginyl-tRNA synthetase